jgi:hypothetical protein
MLFETTSSDNKAVHIAKPNIRHDSIIYQEQLKTDISVPANLTSFDYTLRYIQLVLCASPSTGILNVDCCSTGQDLGYHRLHNSVQNFPK